MTASARGSSSLGLVMIGDDQVEPKVAGVIGGLGRADAAVDRHDEPGAFRGEPIHGRRLQAVAVAESIGHEVDDVTAEQLERAPQDDRGRDAVDVVVAVDGDALLPGDRRQQAIDGLAHAGQEKRVVQLTEVGGEKPFGGVRLVEPSLTEKTSDHGRHADRACDRLHARVVARHVLPPPADHPAGGSGAPSSTNACPSAPIARNFPYRASSRASSVIARSVARCRATASSTRAAARS